MVDAKEVAYYISAHPDDWQLFMVPRAYSDLCFPTGDCKIVFIYFTAGDAGKIDNTNEFWRGREMGSLNAVRSLRGLPIDTSLSPSEKKVCGHTLAVYEMLDNTVSYYLRLPEASLKSGAINNQPPPLQPLGQDEGSTDKFQDWNDLVNTVAQILRNESYGTESRAASWINYVLDPTQHHHENHATAGKCIEAAINRTANDTEEGKVDFLLETFLGYRMTQGKNTPFPQNVEGGDFKAKEKMFQTYDLVANQVSTDRYGKHQHGEYLSWLTQQYTVAEARQANLIDSNEYE